MAAILDTSFCIALASIGQLELLEHLQDLLLPEGAHQELQLGRRKGYRDAARILKQLDHLGAQIREIEAPTVDDEVLALARQSQAVVFSQDWELRRRAQKAGLVAFDTADFLFMLLSREILNLEDYQRLIGVLGRRGLISRDRMRQYLDLNID